MRVGLLSVACTISFQLLLVLLPFPCTSTTTSASASERLWAEPFAERCTEDQRAALQDCAEAMVVAVQVRSWQGGRLACPPMHG